MPPLQRYILALTGGLQDSRAVPEPTDLTELYNFALFRGRFALRAPLTEVVDITSVTAAVTDVLAFEAHQDKIFIASWSSTADIVYLHSMNYDGTSLTFETNLWTGVTTKPRLSMSSFTGGSADVPEDRLYISDYDQGEDTVYWNDTGSTLTTVEEDWNVSGSTSAGRFSLMVPYQFHLWGTGFYTLTGASQLRPEMLRFSQPGLVPGTDPAGGTPPAKEWFSFDHRSVGRRGDKVTAVSFARGNMIVFQSRSCHAIFGYGQRSWATKLISDRVGCAGPYAATATDTDGLCFFWSHDGPYMTDGTTVTFIGDPIKQRIIDVGADETITTTYSPDDGMVYFIVIPDDGTAPSYYLAFDTKRQRWSDGSWFNSAGTTLEVQFAQTISPRGIVVPGPETAPTIGTATAYNHDFVIVDWTNGDLSLGTETQVFRDTTANPTTLRGTRKAGVTEYWDSGISPRQLYYWRVRHIRNNQTTAYSADASATTWCEPQTKLSTLPSATGVRLRSENPLADAEIRIERRNAESENWGVVTTLTTQPVGISNYEDTTVTCGRKYVYRSRTEETALPPSLWVESDEIIACYGGGAEPEFTVADPVGMDLGKGRAYVKLQFTRENFQKTDQLRIYQKDGASYPPDDEPTAILLGNGNITWEAAPWPCPNDESNTQWKCQIWLQGKFLLAGSEAFSPSAAPYAPCGGVIL